MRVIDRPSPNHDARPPGQSVDILVLHYTDMVSAEAALSRLTDAEAKVSAHYCIDEDGTIYRLVPEERRAWHAGVSFWAGARDINARSIGIELVNPGHTCGYRPFPDAQMNALEELARGILARRPIPAFRVLGHSDVAPTRKIDPGELFDWHRLARAGIGLWPKVRNIPNPGPADSPREISDVQSKLARFGYDVAATGTLDQVTRETVSAFQRHFRPAGFDGIPDGETRQLLDALLLQAERLQAHLSSRPKAWQLIQGGKVLGTLTPRKLDWPFLHCDFRPTADFAEIAPLFKAELASLNADLMDRWEQDYERIQALGLKLVPVAAKTSMPIEEFLLHIDGDTAWFRY